MPDGEATVTCVVGLPLEDAFTFFTERIDRWWVRAPLIPRDAVVGFESGRLVAATPDGVRTLGTVVAWEAPTRISMRWHGPHARPGDLVTITFQPEKVGTRVSVHHRRDGLRSGEAAAAVLGLWWGDRLRSFSAAIDDQQLS